MQEILSDSMKDLYDKYHLLFKSNASDAHKLGEYFKTAFSILKVDCEYNVIQRQVSLHLKK